MEINKITSCLLIAGGLLFSSASFAQVVPFNKNTLENDLQGNFEAMVTYAQNITMPHNNYKGDPRPHLTALRDTLLLVQPIEYLSMSNIGIKVVARDKDHQLLGELSLHTPDKLPAHDGDNQNIIYAENMWSVTLPAMWVQPGLTLDIVNGETSGRLTDLNIGAPNEIIINTMDLGMLTNPRERFHFADNSEHHKDYFQKIPVSKLIVNPYEAVKLDEVMLPNGTLLKELDPSTGTWHTGDMRAYTTKILMSHGINLANYGMNSSTSVSESVHPYTATQITAIAAVGRYRNGVVAHGGSGGNGMVTIDASLGNEWSHEVGHNFGLGHYPGETDGSTHRPATDINSAWGWDQFQKRFVANVMWNKRTGAEQVCCSDGIGIPAFEGYQFNRDAMAGGEPTSPISKYTLHTPYVLHDIQAFFENKATFDESSSTGFKKWNSNTKMMEEFKQPSVVESKMLSSQTQLNAIKGDLEGRALLSYINNFDRTNVQASDGSWIRDIYLPNAGNVITGKAVSVSRYSGYGVTVHANGQAINLNRGDVKYFVSDGNTWSETTPQELDKDLSTRVPTNFGVPVTTLVGYYDPEQTLSSYLFPALHGAYGFVYEPTEIEKLDKAGCYIKVFNGKNHVIDNYQLSGFRYDDNLMNKLHINLKQSDDPTKAEVVCNGTVQSSLDIAKPKMPLDVSIIQSESLIGIEPKPEPEPEPEQNTSPEVTLPTQLTGKSGQSIEIKAIANDVDNEPLFFLWETSGLSYQVIEDGKIRLTLPELNVDRTFSVSVTVSDPQGAKATSTTNVIVKAKLETCEVGDPNSINEAAWSANQTYSGGDKVSFNNLVWKAKYWTRNNQPDNSDAWELVSNIALSWSEQRAYSGGESVIYNGIKYTAKWWTRAQRPNISSVWSNDGPAC